MSNSIKSYFQSSAKKQPAVKQEPSTPRLPSEIKGKENFKTKPNEIAAEGGKYKNFNNSSEKQASLSGKRRKVVESDEEYDVKEEMGNQDDLDFIDDKELEDLVKDEEEDDPYLNYKSTIKTPAQNRTKEFPTFRTKQTTECDASKRLDMFGFNKSNEKSVVKSTKTSAFKPRKTNVSTKLPSFTENKEKVNEMEQMSEDQIADGLPEFLHNDKKKDEKGRLMSDPDYDPTTLYIPPAYFNQQTAAMKQFWTIKSK